MEERICSLTGCGKPKLARGFCSLHYYRWKRLGSPGPVQHVSRPHGLTLEEAFRFWMPGDPPEVDVVWPWPGKPDPYGYGMLAFEGRALKAHRVSYEIFRGPIPEGLMIRHTNDIRIDVNPWNMKLGTAADNARDMVERNRQSRTPRIWGSRHHHTRLADDDVREIRRLWATGGWTQHAIAVHYGMAQSSVFNIVHRITWNHLS